MNILWLVTGFILGLTIGAGIALAYINRRFQNSVSELEEEMELIEKLQKEQNNLNEE